jgi:protein-disulfide isomerase
VSEQHKAKSEEAGSKTWLMVIAAVVVAAVIGGGVYYYRGGFGGSELTVAKGDPDVSELMQPGALPDVVIGKADAPVTIVEYASMTCPHCAQFQTVVFPQLKAKYIDPGNAKYMLREFPLDNLAVGAFMLARCAGEDRYYPMVDGLFGTQETWAIPGPEAKDKLLLIARQAGFSKERFDQCLGDKELFNKIVETRSRGHDRFAVDSTPTFFVNGKRMKGDHQLKDFDDMFAELGVTAPAATEAPSASEPKPPSAETPQPSTETSEPSATPSASEPTPPSAETPRPSELPPAADTVNNPPAGASPSPEGGTSAPSSNPESNP